MKYTIRNVFSTAQQSLIGYADTLETAKSLIPDGVFAIEEDAEYPNHFDVLSARGDLYTIEPCKEAA